MWQTILVGIFAVYLASAMVAWTRGKTLLGIGALIVPAIPLALEKTLPNAVLWTLFSILWFVSFLVVIRGTNRAV